MTMAHFAEACMSYPAAVTGMLEVAWVQARLHSRIEDDVFEQAAQTSMPQRRQWCLRRRVPNA